MFATGHSGSGGPARFDVVCIGGSAGSLQPLLAIVCRLPRTFPAAVVVQLHTRHGAGGVLPALVASRTALPVTGVDDGAPLRAGHVHVPCAGGQLVVCGPRRVRRVAAHDEGGTPRSVDVLLRSLAVAHGPRVVAAILSGRLDDGAAGVRAVRRAGGRALAQDPAEAAWPSMPTAAIATGAVDFALPAESLAAAIVALVMVSGAAELFAVRSHPGSAA